MINKTTEKSIFIKDYSKNDSCNYITLSSVILSKENEYEGIIVFEISSEPIDVVMLENNSSGGLGKSGESYLVGKDYLMRSSSRFQNESIMKTIVKNQAVEAALKNKTGTVIIEDYRGVKVLSSFGKLNLPFFDWVILAEIDYQEAVVPIYKIRSEIIFISIFIFIFILIAVIILSKMMTYPIEKLNNAAHEVSKGNLDIEIRSKLSDEIGVLTESFNNMIKKLKHQSKIIEEEQKKSLVSLIDGQEIERQRLSRELHDGLGQSLIGLKLRYESCITKLRNSEDSKTGAEKLRELFDKTIDEIRRISNNLMPAALSEFGLLTAIQNICNEISKTTNTVVKFSVYGKNQIKNQNTDIYIFRIIQEALTNIIKHSGASNAHVNFYFKENEVLIEIKDNGKGFDVSKEKNIKGNGLANMIDRTVILSGKINIKSVISEGTVIEIKIPYQ